MESWAMENFVGETPEASATKNATALGGIRVVDQVIEIVEGYRRLDDGAGQAIERVL